MEASKLIAFVKHNLSGTWTYEIHKQKDNGAEGWEKYGFMNPSYYSYEEAKMAMHDKIEEINACVTAA